MHRPNDLYWVFRSTCRTFRGTVLSFKEHPCSVEFLAIHILVSSNHHASRTLVIGTTVEWNGR